MKITYDSEADALYIRLLEGRFQCRNVELTEDVILDFDGQERLVGIEILDASKVVWQGKVPKIAVEYVPAVRA